MNKWVFTALILAFYTHSYASDIKVDFGECHEEDNKVKRLKCYDKLTERGEGDQSNLQKELTIIEEHDQAILVSEQPTPKEDDKPSLQNEKYKLSANNPNQLVWAMPASDDLRDDSHIEFYISLKYPFYNKKQPAISLDSAEPNQEGLFRSILFDRAYIMYNGLYDFYVVGDRYESAPVISRLQNIGVSFEWDFNKKKNKFRAGWMHESNGQELEKDDIALYATRRLAEGDDFALTNVSRGWDFLQLRFEKSKYAELDDFEKEWWRYHFELRSYFCGCQGLWAHDREDDIWWDPENDAKIAEYDGLRVMGEVGFENKVMLRAELKTGIQDLSNLGGKFTIGYKWNNTRLIAFYFNGYGKEPSTYHLRTQYVGVGLELR